MKIKQSTKEIVKYIIIGIVSITIALISANYYISYKLNKEIEKYESTNTHTEIVTFKNN